jgi:hypothetical protein
VRRAVGRTGPFGGRISAGALDTDTNNLAPRVGFAWRVGPAPSSAAATASATTPARTRPSPGSWCRSRLSRSPNASFGTAGPLSLADPVRQRVADETTNNYGVDGTTRWGVVQTWNADVSRDLRQVWNVGASYTHTRGSSLDILRAPNRDPDGLRIEGVQPFLWQTSEGSSVLHAATFAAGAARPVRGIGGGVTYTLGEIARQRLVARRRRHRGAGRSQPRGRVGALELRSPAPDDRRHLSDRAAVRPEPAVARQRRPWARCSGLARSRRPSRGSRARRTRRGSRAPAADVARGTNGSLRADYTGDRYRCRSDDRSLLQHGGLQRPGCRHVRQFRAAT